MAENKEMNEFVKALGGDPSQIPGAGEDKEDKPDVEEPGADDKDTSGGEPTPEKDTKEKDPETPEDTEDSEHSKEKPPAQDTSNKQAQAFAQMRVHNKQLEKTVKGVAELLGLENVDDPNAVNQALQDKIVESQAKKQNIPKELLERLNLLEEKDQVNTKEENRRQAFLGFQKIKENFSLEDKDLQSFADDLIADGINPFEEAVDLETQYLKKNYSRLLTDAETKGAEKEQKRALKANQHSSSPDNKTGQEAGEQDKITSVRGLTNFFKENGGA